MKPEPLKGKLTEIGNIVANCEVAKKEDIRAAADWLKGSIVEDSNKLDNNQTQYLMSLIDEAFEDVTKDK